MAKRKSKKIIFSIAGLLALAGSAAGVGMFLMNKDDNKIDDAFLQEAAEKIENKILVDISNLEEFELSENARIDLRYIHANNKAPIIGQTKDTIDIYGVISDEVSAYNIKAEYSVPKTKYDELVNSGDSYLDVIKSILSDMHLQNFDANRIQQAEYAFYTSDFSKALAKSLGNATQSGSAANREFNVLMNEVYLQQNQDKSGYEIVYNLVGLENHFDTKGKLTDQFTRVEQVSLPFTAEGDYTLDNIHEYFYNYVKEGKSLTSTNTLYLSNENDTLLIANQLAHMSFKNSKTAKDYGVETQKQDKTQDQGMGM